MNDLEITKKFDEVTDRIMSRVEKQLGEKVDQVKISMRKEIEDAMPSLKSEDVDKLIKENKEAWEAQLADIQKSFTDRIDEMEIAAKKADNPLKYESSEEQIYKALKENESKLQLLKNGSKGEVSVNSFGFDVMTKAVGDMSLSGNVSSSVTTRVPLEDRLPGFNKIPLREVTMLDAMTSRSTSSNRITWVYESAQEGSAGQTAEGAIKNQIDFDITIGNQDIEKTTAFIKATTEMIDDVPWIMGEIQSTLTERLLLAVESTAYTGNGTSPNLNGVRTVATTFAAGSLAGTVDEANILDVLNAALVQIKLANQRIVRPVIFMNPVDVYKMKALKVTASDRRYVDMIYEAGAMLMVSGVPIIESNLVTADDFLIGDFSKVLLVQKGGIRVEVGLDGNDFTYNRRTILAEWRGAVVVKNNDRTAVVKGDFTTAKAALETT